MKKSDARGEEGGGGRNATRRFILQRIENDLRLDWPEGSNTDFTGTKSHIYRCYFNLPCAEYGHIRRQRLFPFVCENGVLVEKRKLWKTIALR